MGGLRLMSGQDLVQSSVYVEIWFLLFLFLDCFSCNWPNVFRHIYVELMQSKHPDYMQLNQEDLYCIKLNTPKFL